MAVASDCQIIWRQYSLLKVFIQLKMTGRVIYFLFVATLLVAQQSFVSSSVRFVYNATTDVEQKTLVRTKLGLISGLITVRNGLNISCYVGIPYAEPPTAIRRFAEPTPVKPWKKTYQAVRQPPICYQREQYYTSINSEDCLYLSIFTQTVPTPESPVANNKTVLVWIHGGAFISGTANLPFQDYPWMVAHDPNLVVVTINYRLNVFGFITTGTSKLPGNNGLKDQIVALKWVKANIGVFGGDASKVILWGQSAGAVGIGYLMMSKQSSSLFQRVILESGNPLLPLTLGTASYRQKGFIDFAGKLNCTTDNHSAVNIKWIDQNLASKVLPCLRTKTTEQLFEEYNTFAVHTPLAFLPNAEDKSLFDFSSFWKGTRDGSFSFNGDILIGTNEAEGAQYVKIGPLEQYYSRNEISTNFTRDNVLATLTNFAPEGLRQMVEPVVDVLIDGVEDQNNSTQLWQRYVELVGDMVFVCPDFFFIKGYTKRRRTANVFYYRFKPLVSHPVDCPSWSLGACHSDEMQFVVGTPLLLEKLYPPEEQKLSRAIFVTWMAFAHHGSLAGGSNESFSHWKPFLSDKPQYLQIELTDSKMVKGFPGQRCEELCEPLYETLETMDDSQMKLIKTK